MVVEASESYIEGFSKPNSSSRQGSKAEESDGCPMKPIFGPEVFLNQVAYLGRLETQGLKPSSFLYELNS